jgi:hypothetical protein
MLVDASAGKISLSIAFVESVAAGCLPSISILRHTGSSGPCSGQRAALNGAFARPGRLSVTSTPTLRFGDDASQIRLDHRGVRSSTFVYGRIARISGPVKFGRNSSTAASVPTVPDIVISRGVRSWRPKLSTVRDLAFSSDEQLVDGHKEFFTTCLTLASLSSSACRNRGSYRDSAPVESVRG